jgi:hypothetical protein
MQSIKHKKGYWDICPLYYYLFKYIEPNRKISEEAKNNNVILKSVIELAKKLEEEMKNKKKKDILVDKNIKMKLLMTTGDIIKTDKKVKCTKKRTMINDYFVDSCVIIYLLDISILDHYAKQ